VTGQPDPVTTAHEVVFSDDAPTATSADAATRSFDAFYRNELASVVALARALVASPDLADDIAQEAMLAAYRNWRKIGDYDNPAAWVRRVCANKAVSEYRRLRYEARTRLRLLSRPAATVEAPAAEDPIWEQVRRLPRRQAQTLALLYIADLSLAEIAEVLGCSVGSVKVHLSRGRRTLSRALEQEPEELT
jgi:RNA polymerase sigma factor (sigma-70 family)